MKKYEYLKVMYYFDISLFVIIIYTTLFYLLHFTFPNTLLLSLIDFGAIFLVCFLAYKEKKTWVLVSIPFAFSIVILYLTSGLNNTLIGSIPIFFSLIYSIRRWDVFITYRFYLDKIKMLLKLLCVAGVLTSMFYLFGEYKNIELLYKAYIVFFFVSIIFLREGRNYNYNIESKKNILVDLFILLSIFVLSSKKLFSLFFSAISFIFGHVYEAFFFVIEKLVIYVLYPIIKIIGDFIKSIFPKVKYPDIANSQKSSNHTSLDDYRKIKNDLVGRINLSQGEKIFLGFLVVFIICLIIFKVIKKQKFTKEVEENVVEEREVIEEEKPKDKQKEGLFKRLNKLLFTDNRCKIMLLYQKLLQKAFKRGIYKKHMTPTSLKNILCSKGFPRESLDGLTSIYNEAKFSNHAITEEMVKNMKKNLDLVSKVNMERAEKDEEDV